MSSIKYLLDGLYTGWQIAKGARKLATLDQPIVTIFGGKRAKKSADYTKQAFECAQMLSARSYSVITGGGPGVMEAGLCGALDVQTNDDKPSYAKQPSPRLWRPRASAARPHALGICVKGVDRGFESACGYETIMTSSFEVRKYLLTRFSQAFIIFPGGYGTMDELFEILNLIKLDIMADCPVVLVGHDYWHNLIHWFDDALKEGLIREQDRRVIHLADSAQEAVELIVSKS